MEDLRQDYSQEETFCQALYDLLSTSPALRLKFFTAHTHVDAEALTGQTLQVRHRDRRHVLGKKKIEFDLFMASEDQRHILIVELKGRGGYERHRQTESIAETAQLHYPDARLTLIFATWEDTQARSDAFHSMTLKQLVDPLRDFAAALHEPHHVTNFLANFDRDAVEGELKETRDRVRAELKALATQLEAEANAYIAATPALQGFYCNIERSYKADIAEIQVHRDPWSRWHGLGFSYTVSATRDLSLTSSARLGKGGRRNVTTLNKLRASLPQDLMKHWQARGVIVRDKFSSRDLKLATYCQPSFNQPPWGEHMKEAIEALLLPAIGFFDAFMDAEV